MFFLAKEHGLLEKEHGHLERNMVSLVKEHGPLEKEHGLNEGIWFHVVFLSEGAWSI